MDFELSDDQQALRAAAGDLLDHHASPARVRAAFDDGTGIDDRCWRAMIDQGWMAAAVPESSGGLGLGVVELAVLCEQVGGHAAPGPFLQHVLALDALVQADTDGAPWVEPWIEALVTGARRATVASRPVVAQRADDAWVLSGRTEPAIGAPGADVAIVVAHDDLADRPATTTHADLADRPATTTHDSSTALDAPPGLFAVELDDVTRPGPEPAMDRTRSLGWLRLDRTPAHRLGEGSAATRFVDLGAVLHSAELLGGAERALAMSVEYAKEREQFGKPIGSFQAIKHRCADMLVDVEGMRSATYYAAWALGADDPEASVAASAAKSWCSDASARVLSGALQVHGGLGFTWEHDLHFFAKRGQLDQVSFGDGTHHRRRLAGLLRTRVAAGQPVL